MSTHDALLRLLSSHLRRYTREPESRESAARNLLICSFMLYAEITDTDRAEEAACAAGLISLAREAA